MKSVIVWRVAGRFPSGSTRYQVLPGVIDVNVTEDDDDDDDDVIDDDDDNGDDAAIPDEGDIGVDE